MISQEYKEIPLTKGFIAKVSLEDYEEINSHKWFVLYNPRKKTAYARRKEKGRQIYMHRVIMRASDKQVDHIDHDGLNNQRNNLRLATASQNFANRMMQTNNTSGYRGVYLVKSGNRAKKWMAQIRKNYKDIFIGYYATKEEAAKAYNEAATEYFGEFSNLNVIC